MRYHPYFAICLDKSATFTQHHLEHILKRADVLFLGRALT